MTSALIENKKEEKKVGEGTQIYLYNTTVY